MFWSIFHGVVLEISWRIQIKLTPFTNLLHSLQLTNAASLWFVFYVANFKVPLTMELLFIETEQKYCETLLLREKIYIYILEKKLPLSYHFRLAIQILLPSQKNWFFLNHFSHLVFSNMLLSAMYNYLYFQHDCVFIFFPKQNDFPTMLWKFLSSRVP